MDDSQVAESSIDVGSTSPRDMSQNTSSSSNGAETPAPSSSSPSETPIIVKPRISENSRKKLYTKVKRDDTKCKRRGRNTGKLAHMMDLPLELFLEITSMLRPVDLLQLSRVSKQFRQTFTSKQSRSLWAAARRNASDVPTPPSSLSEPKYAAAIFEHNCFACGVGRSPKLDHALAVRFCGACWKANAVKGKTLLKQHAGATPVVLTLVPHEMHKYSNVEPQKNGEWDVYYAPEFEAVWSHYSSLSEADRPVYEEKRRAHVLTMHEHAKAVAAWETKSKREQCEEEDNARKNRAESIKQKLRAMGYEEKDFPPAWYPNWSSLVNQPRSLTARIWKQIEPKLISSIDAYREEVARREMLERTTERRRELDKFYDAYHKTLPRNIGPIPTFEQLYSMELVKAMLKEGDGRIPVTQERFDAVVPDEVTRFTEECREELTEKVLEEKVAHAKAHYDIAHQNFMLEPDEPLTPREFDIRLTSDQEVEALCSGLKQPELVGSVADVRAERVDVEGATVLFNCAICRDYRSPLLSYMELAEHVRDTHMARPTRWTYLNIRPKLSYEFNRYASTEAVQILRLLGLPPDTNYADLDKRVVCTCGSPKLTQPVTFSAIVDHVRREKLFYRGLTRGRRIKTNSDDVLHNPHNLDSEVPCLKLIAESDTIPTFNRPPPIGLSLPTLSEFDTSVACKICIKLLSNGPYDYCNQWHFNTLEDIAHHIRTMHLREPMQSDLMLD